MLIDGTCPNGHPLRVVDNEFVECSEYGVTTRPRDSDPRVPVCDFPQLRILDLVAAQGENEMLRVRLAQHHFGDHGDECDDCGEPEPSESALDVLQPLGLASESGSMLYGDKVRAFVKARTR